MNESFWLGLVVGIPFAIFANLITPFFARILQQRSSAARLKALKRQEEQAKVARWLASNPQIFTSYIVKSAVELTLPAGVTVVGVCSVFFGLVLGFHTTYQKIISFAGFLLIIFGYSYYVYAYAKLMGTWESVRSSASWAVTSEYRLDKQSEVSAPPESTGEITEDLQQEGTATEEV